MTYQLPKQEAVVFKKLLVENKIPHDVSSRVANAGYINITTCGFDRELELTLFKRAMKMDGYV